jgi:predicted N-acetyltransferase YhbS
MTLRIDHLFRHPEHTRLVADWIYNEFWQGKPGYSVDTFEGLLRQADDPDRIPLSLLALEDGRPAGTVNLIHTDSDSRPHLHPWLAALIVVPELRHRGIGAALVRALVAEAGRLGIPRLYLGTDIPDFYTALGAALHERLTDTLCIMRFDPPRAGGTTRTEPPDPPG